MQDVSANIKTHEPLPESVLESFRDVVGPGQVLSGAVDLSLYSYDSALDRASPSCVLFPGSAREISSLVKICRQNKIPFVARGAGTNLCGGAIPLRDAAVIAPTKMKRILSIDPKKRIAVVEPACAAGV